jgi:hypothetical protein
MIPDSRLNAGRRCAPLNHAVVEVLPKPKAQ